MTNYCIKRGLIKLRNKLIRATSYEVVKHKLNYRWYSHDLLKAREEFIDLNTKIK